MRILQVSTSDLGGGAERVAWLLHREFLHRGHAATLAVGTKHTNDPSVLHLDNSGRSRGLRGLIATLRDVAGIQYVDFPASQRLARAARTTWDVVVLHNLHGGYFDHADIAAIEAEIPTILVLHDMWMLTGHCAHPLGCERWRSSCGSCPDLSIYPSVRLDFTHRNLMRKRRSLGDTRVHVTSPAQWLCEAAASVALTGGEFRRIPNPIDVKAFAPASQTEARRRLGLPLQRPIVLVPTGTKNDFKDSVSAVKAMSHLEDISPLLVSIGDDPASLHHVQLPRVDTPEEMAAYFAASDVVVGLSHAETAPLVPLEAASCRRPVVASDIPGYREVIQDGRTGRLVPVGDVSALAAALREVLTGSDDTAGMVKEAAAVVAEVHDPRSVAAEWIEWMRMLTAPRSA